MHKPISYFSGVATEKIMSLIAVQMDRKDHYFVSYKSLFYL